MKVIFLDFNGVLDTSDNYDVVNLNNLSILMNVVKLTESKIVITSSIKNTFYVSGKHNCMMNYLLNVLKENDIEVVGFTKKLDNRQNEIIDYLNTHPEITNYCIIDDEYFCELFESHMIKLTSQMDGGNGLQETSEEEIVRKLNV